jgi:tripartite-type tricarboxylate transporter receptor subunit TctC
LFEPETCATLGLRTAEAAENRDKNKVPAQSTYEERQTKREEPEMGFSKKLLGAAAALLMAGTLGAQAQDWQPEGTLTLQIGFGAGGSTDTIGRVLAAQMREQTGWNIVAENVTGGGGIAMFAGIANRPPTNDVVGLGVTMPILINLVRRGSELGFDLDSFAYVGTLANAQLALVARGDAPYDTLEEFLAYAAANPGLTVGFDAPPQQALIAAVARDAGLQFNMVTMESSADSVRFLLGSQVDAAFSSGVHIPYLETGEMVTLASANRERLSYAPDVATFVDLGYNYFVDPYYFLGMHADSDPAAVAAIAAAVDAALQTPAMIEIIQNINTTPPLNLGIEGTRQMLGDSLIVAQGLFGG